MREYKFRKWDFENKEMIDGDSLAFEEYAPISYLLTQEGIMQYTGLKDKNGKEIYEGDIVTTTYGKYELEPNGLTRFGTVIYNSVTASFVISIKNSAVKVSFYDVNKIEIIGNIYANSELLEGGQA